jgi:phosphopantetheinyl transferase
LIDFNISHHGKWTVLVTAENANVGVDVMEVEEPFNQSVGEFFDTLRAQVCTTSINDS